MAAGAKNRPSSIGGRPLRLFPHTIPGATHAKADLVDVACKRWIVDPDLIERVRAALAYPLDGTRLGAILSPERDLQRYGKVNHLSQAEIVHHILDEDGGVFNRKPLLSASIEAGYSVKISPA